MIPVKDKGALIYTSLKWVNMICIKLFEILKLVHSLIDGNYATLRSQSTWEVTLYKSSTCK